MLNKIAFGLFAVCLMTTSSLAQNSDKAKESHDKAIKMINKGKFTGGEWEWECGPACRQTGVSLSRHATSGASSAMWGFHEEN